MLIFEYKGYEARALLNDQAACYEGEVTNLPDLIRFQGLSPTQTQKAFQDCVDLYLMVCQKRGIQPQCPSHSH